MLGLLLVGGEVTAMKFFGFVPVVGLQGSVLPAFIIGVLGAKFEKSLRKVVPDVLRSFGYSIRDTLRDVNSWTYSLLGQFST